MVVIYYIMAAGFLSISFLISLSGLLHLHGDDSWIPIAIGVSCAGVACFIAGAIVENVQDGQ